VEEGTRRVNDRFPEFVSSLRTPGVLIELVLFAKWRAMLRMQLAVLAVLGLAALAVLGWAGGARRGAVALMGVDGAREKAQADQSMFSVVFSRAQQAKHAAALQRRLAAKDIRLSQSLAQAASAQATDGVAAEQAMEADVRRRSALVAGAKRLASVLGAEEQQLRAATRKLDADSKDEHALRRALPQLHRAEADLIEKLARARRREQSDSKGVKTRLADAKKAKQVLRQAVRAYDNYEVRAESAHEKQRFALSKASLLRAKALVDARQAMLDQTAARSDAGKAPAKARRLTTAAANARAQASLLKAKAAEGDKSAQVWEAKQEEALSYMKMMKTDVGAAEQRVHRLESIQRAGAMDRLVQRQIERVSIFCPVSAYCDRNSGNTQD
jgi:hypothetical protein